MLAAIALEQIAAVQLAIPPMSTRGAKEALRPPLFKDGLPALRFVPIGLQERRQAHARLELDQVLLGHRRIASVESAACSIDPLRIRGCD